MARGRSGYKRKPGGLIRHLGSGTYVPCCYYSGMWQGRALSGQAQAGLAGASPIRLALTTRILSVWLTRRPRPSLRAPTKEMRLLLQQNNKYIMLPSE